MDILTELDQLAERTRGTYPEVAIVLYCLRGALSIGIEGALAKMCADFAKRAADEIHSNLGPSSN